MIIGPTTPIGKIRLRIGDWADLPVLPDAVIEYSLIDLDGNVPSEGSLFASQNNKHCDHK